METISVGCVRLKCDVKVKFLFTLNSFATLFLNPLMMSSGSELRLFVMLFVNESDE